LLPVTFITFLIGTLAISGIPPFAGFFSKDEILANAFAHNQIIWGIAAFASLLTAFYMFRLFFLTFSGTNRASEEVQHHIHESPKSMTIPLMVLAVLSLIGGFMGIPEVLGGSHVLNNFLAPVFEQSRSISEAHHHLDHNTEYMLMGVIVGLTLILIFIAWMVYVRGRKIPAAEGVALNPTHKLVYNKYYIDELYNSIIVKPLTFVSKVLDSLVEKLFIDNIVNGTGKMVTWGSKTLRLVQTGNIGFYIFAMVISIIIMLVAKSIF
jgi:NADH-quinone oxidoreductase subunit L